MAHNPASDQRQQALVSGGAPDPRRWQALALVCVAFFMTVLDVSIVTVALPSIASSLHFSQTDLQWVLVAYTITFGGFLLLGGRAGDLLGRRLMFMVGLALFTVASLTCGLAGSAAMLVTARAFQGLGAAFISPTTLSIITTTFEEGPERNKALGIWGAMGGSGAAAGVLFGGSPHQLPGLGINLFCQRPGGSGRVGGHSISGPGKPRPPGGTALRRGGRSNRHRRRSDARLRHLPGAHRGLGQRGDDRPAGCVLGAARVFHLLGGAHRRSAHAARDFPIRTLAGANTVAGVAARRYLRISTF